MTTRHIDQVLVEVAAAQQRLETLAVGLTDNDVRAPSALEGWTRAHVLTHLARNADSLVGMLDGVRRGEIVSQYPGGDEQRSRDIERGAVRSADEIFADLVAGHEQFLAIGGSLSNEEWSHLTRPRVGDRPAWATGWMRWREVEVHTVDLDLPPEPGLPRLSAAFTDEFLPPELDRLPRRLSESLHEVATDDVVLTGEPAERLLWLMGRPSDSVRLRVSGSEVRQDALADWVLTAWLPGGPSEH